MTVAKIFLYVFFLAPAFWARALPAGAIVQSAMAEQQPQQAGPPAGSAQPGNANQPQTTAPKETPPDNSAAGRKRKKSAAGRKNKQKTAANSAVDCSANTTPADSANPTAPSPANAPPAQNPVVAPNVETNQATAGQVPTDKSAAPPAAATSSNCPPSKTIVREGGITEAPIQLVGGKGAAQASQQRTSTDQLLDSTEDNLKKVAGRQLTSSQQEVVTQIQQFVLQSRAAVSAGDIDRGHTLAQKAHLLSDELVKP